LAAFLLKLAPLSKNHRLPSSQPAAMVGRDRPATGNR